jgi:parallel beta-helix repeat protein
MKRISAFFVFICVVSVSFTFISFTDESAYLEPFSTQSLKTRAGTYRFVGGVGPGNYSIIQNAVDASSPGDTVRIYDGIYYEDVYLNATLSVIGNGSSKSIINGTGQGNVITVNADWCNVTGLNITGSGGSNLSAGIRLNSNNNRITGCDFNRNYLGIHLNESSNNDIQYNTIEWNHGVSSEDFDDAEAHWRMDESSWSGTADEVKDSSGNKHHAVAQNGATTAAGRFGRAGTFDGVNDCVDCGLDDEYNFSAEITLAGWVYVKGTTSWPTIISKRSSWHLTSGNGIGYWRMGVYLGGPERMANSAAITLNKWYHIAGTYDGSYVRVFINGKLDTTSSMFTGNIVSSTNKAYIGPLWGMTGSYQFNGLIDEVRAYDRALSEDEIYSLYASNNLANGSSQACGMLLSGSANNTVSNNTLNSNTGHGLQISSSENNLIENNNITDNYCAGINLDDSSMNLISDNTLENNHGLEPTNDGLVCSWQMINASWDGSQSEVLDSSESDNHGSASGNAQVSPYGRFGRAAEFDGSGDYINTTTPVIEDRNVTYGGWIKWRTIAADGSGFDVPIQQADALDAGFEIYTDAIDSKVYVWDGVSTAGGYLIDTNVWYHVYAIHNGTHFALFVNGSLVGNWVASTESVAQENFTIGGGAEQNTYWFDGFIDDVRVYNRSLSNEELNTTYLTGVHSGIYVDRSWYNNVTENRCESNEGAGIGLFDSFGNFVKNNTLIDNQRSGIFLNRSIDNWISNNTAEKNNGSGIYLDSIALWNNITYNTLLNNQPYGVHINKSIGNRIQYNWFINDLPTAMQGSDDGTSNDWDWNNIGNYWSDHQAPDVNTPYGITDTVYDLDGTAGAKDDFPICSAITPPVNVTPYEDLLYSESCGIINAILPGVFSFQTNAGWLTCLADGSFSGTPTNGQVGTYWVNASVTDKYSTFFRNFTIQVMNINDLPTITTTNDLTAKEDELYWIIYTASDIDLPGDTLTWGVATTAGFLSMDSLTGNLSGTPLNSDVGNYPVNVTVDDGHGGTDWTEFDLSVENTNDDPVIITTNLTTATEEQLYENDYDATDVDPTGDDLLFQWSVETNMSSSFLTIDSGTGYLSGIPDDEHVGQHWVKVTVSDTRGGSDSVNFTLTVSNVNDDPYIITEDKLDAYEDQPYFNNYVAGDVDDGDTVFIWNMDSNADFLQIDTGTGNLSGLPNQGDVGVYWVNVTVKDAQFGEGFSYFTLTVHNINDAPVWDKVPTSKTIFRDSSYSFEAEATDDDTGAELTYGIVSTPASDITIDAATGLIEWTPTEVGTYALNLSCTDTFVTIYYEYALEVISDNNRPTTTLTYPVNNTEVEILNPILMWTTYDKDGDDLTCDLYYGKSLSDVQSLDPGSLMGEDLTDNSFKTGNLEIGTEYYWTVVPYDGEEYGYCRSGYYHLTVKETASINHLPEFTTSPQLEAGVGVEWTYEPEAIDKDNDSISITLESGPQGMYFSGGILQWTPSLDQLGENDVELKAFDGKESAFQSFKVTVTEDGPGNRPPVVSSIEDTTAEEGETVSIQLDVEDPDGDIVAYEITDGPAGAKISYTGLFTWDTAEGDAGTYEVEITVEDGEFTITMSFNITIDEKTVVTDDDDDDDDGGSFMSTYWWIFLILLLFVIVAIIVVVILVVMKKRKKDEEEEQVPEVQPAPQPPPVQPDREVALATLSAEEQVPPRPPAQAYAQPMAEPYQPGEPQPPEGASIYDNLLEQEQAMPPEPYQDVQPAYPDAQMPQPDLYVSPGHTELLPPPSEEPAPFMQEPEPDLPEPSIAQAPESIVVQCYNCASDIPITSDERPVTVTCPGCGLPSVLE